VTTTETSRWLTKSFRSGSNVSQSKKLSRRATTTTQRRRNAVRRQLEATGMRGVVLAAKLSRTNGPIALEPGDADVLETLKQRLAGKSGIVVADNNFSYDASA
jgi:hypothetical protein